FPTRRSSDLYKKLREQLRLTANWPAEYLYKFIIPTDIHRIAILESIFDNMGAVINTVESKNGKYTSVSINILMRNPDAVIEKYLEFAEKVVGVISLKIFFVFCSCI